MTTVRKKVAKRNGRVSKKVISKRQLDDAIKRELEIFTQQSEARFRLAMDHFNHQDQKTQHAIERLRDRIVAYSHGVLSFNIGGHRVTADLDAKFITMNALYMATELMKDLAAVDVRIENYEFPDLVCIECGEPLKPRKRRRRG